MQKNTSQIRARIYRSHQRVFTCKLLEKAEERENEEMIVATALGNLLKEGELVVGDYVFVERQNNPKEWVIVGTEERRNEVFRVIIREQKKKATASNIDFLAIIVSMSRPAFKRGLLDRYLIRSYQWGINPFIVFNKMDQYEHGDGGVDILFEKERLKFLGVPCFEVSALNASYQPRFFKDGLLQLKDFLRKKTILFQGQSGVGKSKLITALTGGKIELKSQSVGKVGKGTHTTTWVEMIEHEDYLFMDAPGIRSFSIEDILADNLIAYYPDIESISLRCRFSNCTHDKNLADCAFFSSVDARNGQAWDSKELEIIHSRLESYKEILQEISVHPFWSNNFKDK